MIIRVIIMMIILMILIITMVMLIIMSVTWVIPTAPCSHTFLPGPAVHPHAPPGHRGHCNYHHHCPPIHPHVLPGSSSYTYNNNNKNNNNITILPPWLALHARLIPCCLSVQMDHLHVDLNPKSILVSSKIVPWINGQKCFTSKCVNVRIKSV